MLFQRHGWDIHAISAEPDRASRHASQATSVCQERSSTTSTGPDACRLLAIGVNRRQPH
jgi:hypothetical protein